MKREEALEELRKILDKTINERSSINIKLYFNSDNELEICCSADNKNYLTHVGNSEDSPLEPYLETFVSSFTKLKRKRHE